MLSMIAAIGKNRELGQRNQGTGLPWTIPEDMKYFRDTTRGHTVIMGQGTYEVLGRPLPNRRNIVLTREKNFSFPGIEVVHSPEEALEAVNFPPLQREGTESRLPGRYANDWASRRGLDSENLLCPKTDISSLAGGGNKEEEIFIIGGAAVYSLFLPKAGRLYLTIIDAEFPEADVFFPEYKCLFKEVSRRESEDENFSYAFTVLEKN